MATAPRRPFCMLGVCLAATACAGGQREPRSPAGTQAASEGERAPPAAEPGHAAVGNEGDLQGSVPGARPLAERKAPVDGRQPDPSRSLPEIRLRHIGLHVGGGPNDEETRRPILRAIEGHTERFLKCYRHVDRPLRGGVYGVDLYVAARGGSPEVRATRQKLGPEAFDACMMDAFRGVRMPRPPRPTVVSYSLRFDVLDDAGT